MDNVINLAEKRMERNFDRNADPCSLCNEINQRKNCPCEEADIWWEIAAKLLKKGKL